MYKLIVRNQEPIFIQDESGERLLKMWLNQGQEGVEMLPARISFKGIGFYSADIRAINKVAPSEAEVGKTQNVQDDREYQEYRRKILSLSLEERAEIMRVPNLVWSSQTKQEMPEDIIAEIKKRQLAYFQENPNCMYCNPKVYKNLIPKPYLELPIENMQRLSNVLYASTLRLIQNMIEADLKDSVRV